MEYLEKEYVIDRLNEIQLEHDAYGDTDKAINVAKIRLEFATTKGIRAVPIKEETTNGEIYMKIFPKHQIIVYTNKIEVIGENYEFRNAYRKDWWDSKYKGEENVFR